MKKKGYHNDLCYEDIQKFKKRLRSYLDYHEKKKIEIFNVHEYGKNGKKHWHLVLFNHSFRSDKTLYTTSNGLPLYTSASLKRLWPWGHHTIGDVTEASAMYQAQYTQKDIKNGNTHNAKKSKSNHSGIGKNYFLQNYRQILSLGFIPFNGSKIPVPRYFQKLAHKHYSHYYAAENFCDYPHRKRLYSPLKPGTQNAEIANLYKSFRSLQEIQIEQRALEWEATVKDLLEHPEKKPDFYVAAQNYLYDQRNKGNNNEKF